MELQILCFLLLTIGLEMVALTTAKKSKGRDGTCKTTLRNPSFLAVPEFKKKMEVDKLILPITRDTKWNCSRLDKPDIYIHFCYECIEITLDPNRKPMMIPQRRCDHQRSSAEQSCSSDKGSVSSFTCDDQTSYQIVKINGCAMYQQFYSGCACIATTRKADSEKKVEG